MIFSVPDDAEMTTWYVVLVCTLALQSTPTCETKRKKCGEEARAGGGGGREATA